MAVICSNLVGRTIHRCTCSACCTVLVRTVLDVMPHVQAALQGSMCIHEGYTMTALGMQAAGFKGNLMLYHVYR